MNTTTDYADKLSKYDRLAEYYSTDRVGEGANYFKELKEKALPTCSLNDQVPSRSHVSAIRNHHYRRQRGQQRCNSIDKAPPHNYMGLFSAAAQRYSTTTAVNRYSNGSNCIGHSVDRSSLVNRTNSVLCLVESKKLLIANSQSKAINQIDRRPLPPLPLPLSRHLPVKRTTCISNNHREIPIIVHKPPNICNLQQYNSLSNSKPLPFNNCDTYSPLSLPASPVLYRPSGKFSAKFEAQFGAESASSVLKLGHASETNFSLLPDNSDLNFVSVEGSAVGCTKVFKRNSLPPDDCLTTVCSGSHSKKPQANQPQRCNSCPPEEASRKKISLEKLFNINILEKTHKNQKTKSIWRSLNMLLKPESKNKGLPSRELKFLSSQSSINSVMNGSDFGSLPLHCVHRHLDRNRPIDRIPQLVNLESSTNFELLRQVSAKTKNSKELRKDGGVVDAHHTSESQNLKVDEGYLVKVSSKGRLNEPVKTEKQLLSKMPSAKVRHNRSFSRSCEQLVDLSNLLSSSESSPYLQRNPSRLINSHQNLNSHYTSCTPPVFWTPRPSRARGAGAVERRVRRGTTTLSTALPYGNAALNIAINETDAGTVILEQ